MNKPLIGAAVGAAAALVWVLISGWALIAVALFAAVGCGVGVAVDRPGIFAELMDKVSGR